MRHNSSRRLKSAESIQGQQSHHTGSLQHTGIGRDPLSMHMIENPPSQMEAACVCQTGCTYPCPKAGVTQFYNTDPHLRTTPTTEKPQLGPVSPH